MFLKWLHVQEAVALWKRPRWPQPASRAAAETTRSEDAERDVERRLNTYLARRSASAAVSKGGCFFLQSWTWFFWADSFPTIVNCNTFLFILTAVRCPLWLHIAALWHANSSICTYWHHFCRTFQLSRIGAFSIMICVHIHCTSHRLIAVGWQPRGKSELWKLMRRIDLRHTRLYN